MPISWNTVIFKFRLIFATDERRIVSAKAFHMVFCEAHWSQWCHIRPFSAYTVSFVMFVDTDQWASPKHLMKGHSHNFSLIGRKTRAKFENDCVSKNGHRIKITQPNSMILVSFSSAENVYKNMTLLGQMVLKICRSAFFGHPLCFFWTPVIAYSYTFSVCMKLNQGKLNSIRQISCGA